MQNFIRNFYKKLKISLGNQKLLKNNLIKQNICQKNIIIKFIFYILNHINKNSIFLF